MAVDTAGNTDWASVASTTSTLTDTPSGTNDNSFAGGTKESDTSVGITTGSIPDKNDLLRAYLSSETVGGKSFLYLAWVRSVSNGDAHVDFELDQNSTPGWTGATSSGTVNINRTPGDLLISYDFGGSGTPDITLFTW